MKLDKKVTVFETPIFSVEELSLTTSRGTSLTSRYRIACRDWANILPIRSDKKAVLIRQPRFGNLQNVLETPGGVLDPGENDPMLAALRELEEETGYSSTKVLSLGSFNPNPAIMTNRIHFFLALECRLLPNRTHFQDPDEEIDLELCEIGDLDQLVRTSRIDHALSAFCIQLALKYLTA